MRMGPKRTLQPYNSQLLRPPSASAAGRVSNNTWQMLASAVDNLGADQPAPASLSLDQSAEPIELDLGVVENEEGSLSETEKTVRARRRVEAILFLSRESLSARKIAQLAGLADATQARTLCRHLNELYQAESHAFQIEETAGGYMLMTRPQFARWLRQLDQTPADLRLGLPALETLTIIAYRQPVVRAYVEAVRGSNCDEVLKQLLDRDLIRIAGRSEDLGRPYLYGTTKRFLQVFGIKSLEHLPKKEWVLKTDLQFPNPSSDDSIHETEFN